MYTRIITKAYICDGTGREGFVGDVAISGDRIAKVDTHINARSREVINGQGLVSKIIAIPTGNYLKILRSIVYCIKALLLF
jgi:N-acyl-D-aspartate/D-glutamate deacylase